MCAIRSPWIRFVEIDGREQPTGSWGPSRMLWLTTGDILNPLEIWPVDHLPVSCAICEKRFDPFMAPVSPFWDGERLVWYCHDDLVRTRRHFASTYPRFDIFAAPGEEWRSRDLV